MFYQIELTPDDNDTFLVTVPAFPEVATFGADRDSARANAIEAIEEAIGARMAHAEDVPLWSEFVIEGREDRVAIPVLTVLKAALYRTMRAQGINRSELARRLGWHREQVDRLFRVDHASRIDQLEAAFAAVGNRIDVKLFPVAA